MDKQNGWDKEFGDDFSADNSTDFTSDFLSDLDYDFLKGSGSSSPDPDSNNLGFDDPYSRRTDTGGYRSPAGAASRTPSSGTSYNRTSSGRTSAGGRPSSTGRASSTGRPSASAGRSSGGRSSSGSGAYRSSGGSYRSSASGGGGSSRSGSGRGKRGVKGSPLFSALFFPCILLFHELLLRLYDPDVHFFGAGFLPILFFSLAYGFLVFFILDVIPAKKVSRILGGVLIFIFIVILCVERGMKATFNMYYGVLAGAGVAGNVVGNFAENIITTIKVILFFILLSLIPFVLFILLRATVIRERGQQWLTRVLVVFLAAVCGLFGFMFSNIGSAKAAYTYDFTTPAAIPHFGLATAVRLEFKYAIFGTPEADIPGFLPNDDDTSGSTGDSSKDSTGDTGDSTDPTGDTGDSTDTTPPQPIEYGFNTLDIDFEGLAASTSNKTLKQMHEYFGSLTPSQQNQYTGLFKGKNLILICAESFDDYVIDPELTPTLYRMTQQEGFVFTNFYQPDWTLSTAGGEFSVTTGVIPNWVSKSDSPRQSINNDMSTTLGNMFRSIGYATPAWHNGDYTFYSRNKYLATYGYDFKAIGSGLELPTTGWLRSDTEMIEATADQYINNYLQTGQPFHAYYMTISGHGPWKFAGNKWATKYKDLIKAKYPTLSDPCAAFLAANIEVDRALEALVKKLENAGIADDTLIVMCADHYPYFLYQGNSQQGDSTDYYNELNALFGQPQDDEKVTSRYRNTLLMWSASIPRTVVDTPCYSCDIVPTVANLFGLEYDSRLYTGRDIFATNYEADKYSTCMPLVIFANNHGQGNSWITAAGTYEASTGKFTANEGVTVSDDYVSKVKSLVSGKIQMSKKIITEDYYSKIFK